MPTQSSRTASVLAALLVLAAPLYPLPPPPGPLASSVGRSTMPAAAPQAHPERRAAIITSTQNGQPVRHPSKAAPGQWYTGYTDTNLERVVPDAKLRIAFEMALSDHRFRYSLAPAFLALPDARITRQSADAESAPGAWAYTYPKRDWVVIGDRLYQEETAVIAGIIVHEVYHAVHSDHAGRGEACLSDEFDAHTWGSLAFGETLWPIAYGPNATVSGAGLQLLDQYWQWQDGSLRERLRAGYTANGQCF